MHRMENSVALVTGGAAGIGRSLCEQLAASGARTVVADINLKGAQVVVAAIRERGGCAEAAQVDVARAEQMEKLVHDVAATHDRLDFMFNNAAIAAVGELRDGNVEDFRRVVDV